MRIMRMGSWERRERWNGNVECMRGLKEAVNGRLGAKEGQRRWPTNEHSFVSFALDISSHYWVEQQLNDLVFSAVSRVPLIVAANATCATVEPSAGDGFVCVTV